jgi:hypothetical protein
MLCKIFKTTVLDFIKFCTGYNYEYMYMYIVMYIYVYVYTFTSSVITVRIVPLYCVLYSVEVFKASYYPSGRDKSLQYFRL